MTYKMKHKNSTFPFKSKEKSKKKKDERTENQKAIEHAIEEGYAPKPNTKKKLKQYEEAYFEEKSV